MKDGIKKTQTLYVKIEGSRSGLNFISQVAFTFHGYNFMGYGKEEIQSMINFLEIQKESFHLIKQTNFNPEIFYFKYFKS